MDDGLFLLLQQGDDAALGADGAVQAVGGPGEEAGDGGLFVCWWKGGCKFSRTDPNSDSSRIGSSLSPESWRCWNNPPLRLIPQCACTCPSHGSPESLYTG
jgi:hypothetical protein